MSGSNNSTRLWIPIVIALVAALFSFVGYLLQQELDDMDRRLDQLNAFVLEHYPTPPRQ